MSGTAYEYRVTALAKARCRPRRDHALGNGLGLASPYAHGDIGDAGTVGLAGSASYSSGTIPLTGPEPTSGERPTASSSPTPQ